MLRVIRHPNGPRVYVAGRRLHHGVGGTVAAAAAIGFRRRRLAIALAIWAATDWRDFPFRDDCNH